MTSRWMVCPSRLPSASLGSQQGSRGGALDRPHDVSRFYKRRVEVPENKTAKEAGL